MTNPTYHSPAGAAVYISRNHRVGLTSIRIDRFPINDATPSQCAAVEKLAISEWVNHVVPVFGVARSTSFSADPTLWQLWVLSSRERTVIRQLHHIERDTR